MRQDTFVTTSAISGTTINMEPVAMKFFLTNLAISTIAQIREIRSDDEYHLEINLPHYNELVEEYCNGVPSATLAGMLEQNIDILYQFVRDCVENDTKKGLYLLIDISRQGNPFWKIILQALDEYTEFVKNEAIKSGRTYIRYNGLNDKFQKLMERPGRIGCWRVE